MTRTLTDGNVKVFKSYEYTYWRASITIMRRKYYKTFPYTDEGYNDAVQWLENHRFF